MGHVFLHSPSDVFGSLISDTEEFLEDFQMNHRASLGTNVYSPISQSPPNTPPISPPPQFRITASHPTAPITFKAAAAARPQDDDDERPVPADNNGANDMDRNALVEFNRKKAQHEMFQ